MQITLRAGEKLYLNGAVLRADRKVCLELMNDATFLLEAHVMSVERATTPLRQLYFVVQMMLMNPHDAAEARRLFAESMTRMLAAYEDGPVLAVLGQVRALVVGGRHFEALKSLRGVFGRDDALLAPSSVPSSVPDLALAS